MTNRARLIIGIALLNLLLASQVGNAAEFQSCREVRNYLNGTRPIDAYARVADLENATQAVKQEIARGSSECDDVVVELVFFEYARETEDLGNTFTDPQTRRTWASAAATAYIDYLNWFTDISESRQSGLIRVLLRLQSASDEEIRREKGKWLRKRVGGVLNNLGAAYIRAENHEELINSYQKYSDVVEIYSNEVVRKWYRVLQTKPDFQRVRQDMEIRALISRDGDVVVQWETFMGFLSRFVEANPSVKDEWTKVMRKISQWLSA